MLRDKRANRYLELDPPEYYPDRFMTGNASFAAVAGQFSQIDLYNDGSLGTPILLYGLTVQSAVNSIIYAFPAFGHGAVQVLSPISLNPLNPLREGKIYRDSAVSTGQTGFAMPVGGNGIYQWPYSWPITEIITGWSLRFLSNIAATTLTIGLIWMIEPTS